MENNLHVLQFVDGEQQNIHTMHHYSQQQGGLTTARYKLSQLQVHWAESSQIQKDSVDGV